MGLQERVQARSSERMSDMGFRLMSLTFRVVDCLRPYIDRRQEGCPSRHARPSRLRSLSSRHRMPAPETHCTSVLGRPRQPPGAHTAPTQQQGWCCGFDHSSLAVTSIYVRRLEPAEDRGWGKVAKAIGV
jgi:hypothetical protein